MRDASAQSFLWGTATSAHQVEGGNWNSDWWAWEHDPASPCVEPSGDACDHYHRYPDDIALLADLGFGSYRFSIEWARIEPEEGEFSFAALEHYLRMLECCREHGLVPVVTFHHFTSPRWVAAGGGWTNRVTAERFARFCERAAGHLAGPLGIACTLNEPNIVARFGYRDGTFPPGRRDQTARKMATEVFVDAHRLGYEAIKSQEGNARVGLTLAMSDYQAVDGGNERMESERSLMEDVFLDAARDDDFVGVQTYTRTRIGPDGPLGPEEGVPTTTMGYEFWPAALAATVTRAHEVTSGCPIIVTENGVAVDDDDRRIDFVEAALDGLAGCVRDGIDVRGYFYWSAFDNFEWALGYAPRFGLVAVDRSTQQRTPKPSAYRLGDIARTGGPPTTNDVDPEGRA